MPGLLHETNLSLSEVHTEILLVVLHARDRLRGAHRRCRVCRASPRYRHTTLRSSASERASEPASVTLSAADWKRPNCHSLAAGEPKLHLIVASSSAEFVKVFCKEHHVILACPQ